MHKFGTYYSPVQMKGYLEEELDNASSFTDKNYSPRETALSDVNEIHGTYNIYYVFALKHLMLID